MADAPELATPQATGSRARTVARVYLTLALLLAPWIVYLAITLPQRNLERHYAIAWVGFDCLVIVALGRTAWLAFKRSPAVVMPAAVTSALLITDAWFDLLTSNGPAFWQAVVLALLVELPCAAVSLMIARRAIANLTWRAQEGEPTPVRGRPDP
jgi:hypothetical protein